jgi:hypothetical protein
MVTVIGGMEAGIAENSIVLSSINYGHLKIV